MYELLTTWLLTSNASKLLSTVASLASRSQRIRICYLRRKHFLYLLFLIRMIKCDEACTVPEMWPVLYAKYKMFCTSHLTSWQRNSSERLHIIVHPSVACNSGGRELQIDSLSSEQIGYILQSEMRQACTVASGFFRRSRYAIQSQRA